MRSCWDIFCILQLFNFFFLFCNFEFFVRPGSQDKWKHPYHSEQTTGTLKPFQGLTILGIWKFCFVYVFISFNFYTDVFRDLRNFFHSLSSPPTWKWILLAKEGGKYYSNILRGLGFFMKKKKGMNWDGENVPTLSPHESLSPTSTVFLSFYQRSHWSSSTIITKMHWVRNKEKDRAG